MLTDTIITTLYIPEESRDQFVKNISFNVFYSILNYTLNDIIELDLRLIVFYNYIAELLRFGLLGRGENSIVARRRRKVIKGTV